MGGEEWYKEKGLGKFGEHNKSCLVTSVLSPVLSGPAWGMKQIDKIPTVILLFTPSSKSP